MNVLIADSNRMQAQLLTGALRRRPEFQISGCQMNSASILESVALQCPRVALLCFCASGDLAQEFATLRRFHFSHREIQKMLLVESCSRDFVVQAFRSGARGIFTITDCNLRVLCKCILRVAAGQIWANSEQLNYLLELISEIPSLRVLNSRGNSLLTPREEQVVALVAEGLGNRQIATELHLSEHTVKTYVSSLLKKLRLARRAEAAAYVARQQHARAS
jgi:DNA-binding NarL/FixJ family response regulator